VGTKPATLNVTVTAPATSGSVALSGNGVIATGPTIAATVFTDSQNVAGNTVTSPAVTPAANTLLVAFISADAPETGTNTIVTGMTNSGAALSTPWAMRARSNGQRGTAEVWWAYTTTAQASMTVTATLNNAGQARSITVVAFTGAASSLATAAANIANGASGAPTASLTTTAPNSFVFAVGTDWSQPRTMTPGTGQILVHQFNPTVGDSYWVQRTNVTVAASGTVVTMSDTYGATMPDVWNLAVIEIRVP
jgi:hypothetical protein